MAAGPWKVYARAKRAIGAGNITLGAGVFKMQLFRPSASAAIAGLATRSLNTSIPGEISAVGGYVAGGRNLPPATGRWTVGASSLQMKFSYTAAGLIFTASGASLSNIKYALIRNSTGSGVGRALCFCTLSSSAFTVTSPNTLTISPNALGVFTLT